MRVGTAYQYDVAKNRITDTNAAMFDAQQRVSTGKRINSLSDDPYGLGNVVSMRSLGAGLEQYNSNIGRASNWLKNNESTLGEVTKLLNRANVLAVSGANATTGQTERAAMSTEVEGIRDRIVKLSNTRDSNGEYIFAGTKTDTQPFAVSGSGISYQGDTGQVQVEAGPGQNVVINTDGQSLFTSMYTRLDELSKALLSGSASQVGTQGIADVQASLKDVSGVRGNLGIRSKNLEEMVSQSTRRSEDLTQSISDVEDVDFTQAIMDLKSAETAYQASLQVASQGFRLSLMDFIRA